MPDDLNLTSGMIWADPDRCPRCGRWLSEDPTDRWPDIFCISCGKGYRY